MKSTKTKKFLGGVAIAAVSLGCLGLAGIANANDTNTNTGATVTPASTTYPFNSALLKEAMTGNTNITFNIASDQAATNPLSDHKLAYIQLGSYYGKLPTTPSTTGTDPSDFTVISQTQDVANEIGTWAAQNAGYTAGDGDPLTWLVSQGKLGTDLSGQANSGSMASADINIRNLANALYEIAGQSTTTSLGARQDITLTDETTTSGTWAAPAPGVYLVIDQDGANASMPMIISTMPSSGWAVPAAMADLITNKVALKTQDPLTPPVKQFAIGATWTDGVSGGKLSSSASATIGSANAVTYQVAGVFPNFYGYPAYSYAFVDNPGVGLTLNINGGTNLAVAGIPISTLMTDAGANNVTVYETYATTPAGTGGASGTTVSANSADQLTNIKNLVGGSGAELKVVLNQTALKELITLKAKSTVTTDGSAINEGAALADYQVTAPMSDPTGQNNGAKSWTGQTTPTTQYFGLDYQAYLNSKVDSGTSMGSSTMGSSTMGSTGSSSTMGSTTRSSSSRGDSSASPAEGSTTGSTASTKAAAVSMTDPTPAAAGAGVTEAGNTASIINNGTQTGTSGNVPLQSSGSYNGGDTNQKGKTSSTTQTNPDTISGTTTNGTTDGVPNKTAVGAGLTWMKIWNSGEVAKGAEFQVQNSSGNYLFATGNGWAWAAQKADAETFQAATPYTGVNAQSDGGLFQISGLGAGTYKVTETQQATGAASVLPSFYVTIASGKPEEISFTAPEGATATNGFNMASSQGGLTSSPRKRG